MKNNDEHLVIKVLFSILILSVIAVVVVSGFCWQYSLATWGHVLQKDVHIALWQGIVLGCVPVFGQCSLFIAAGTWILMMFIH